MKPPATLQLQKDSNSARLPTRLQVEDVRPKRFKLRPANTDMEAVKM